MARRDRWLGTLILAGSLAGCVTDHDALQKKPSVANGAGAGGAPAAAGAPTIIGGSDGEAATGGGHADDEPPGKNVLTIINGVVDAPSVVLCFAKLDSNGGVTPFGEPLTKAPFEYGQNLVLGDVTGAKVDTDTLEPLLIAGELDLVSGLSCEDAVARAQDEEASAIDANTGAGGEGGVPSYEVRSRLRLGSLPAIPAGTLNAGRSILYVATGCIGGATYNAAKSEEYCGDGYSEQQPTLSGMLASLSRRVQFGETGLQFVHASLATPPSDVSSHPPFPSTDPGIQIATAVVEGQVSPHSALLTHSALEYGSAKSYTVQISAQGSPVTDESWVDVLARGGVKALEDGSTYALVLLGPRVDHAMATPLWNPSAVTVIPVDPL
jgi:hypothetical protein